MNEGTRNQLEVRLKKMLDHLDQAEAKQKPSIPQPVTGNIIRCLARCFLASCLSTASLPLRRSHPWSAA